MTISPNFMEKLIRDGRVINWRRVGSKIGARLQVLYPHHIDAVEKNMLQREIAEAENCDPHWVEMLPRNAAVDGTEI